MIKVALADDHILLRNGLAAVVNSFGNYSVIYEADNGKHFIELMKSNGAPDILLLDITMPEMNGFETATWIKENNPSIKVLVLSMMDDDSSIIKMLRAGAKGYILKDSRPDVLRAALDAISKQGFFLNELVSGKLAQIAINKGNDTTNPNSLTEKEIEFLRFCCTEKSYKEIATAMNISPRAVEALRSNLFEKMDTQSRVGLAVFAIKNNIVKI